ncbi:DExH-box ATP-dependent RNA helicase DExH9 [Glycine soja]
MGSLQDCMRHASYPHGYTHPSSQTHTTVESAKNFSFPLDPFQSKAITCLQNAEFVMVFVHTFARKTMVALYVIGMSLYNGQRVIYTSPIKALSNQKYKEFKDTRHLFK